LNQNILVSEYILIPIENLFKIIYQRTYLEIRHFDNKYIHINNILIIKIFCVKYILKAKYFTLRIRMAPEKGERDQKNTGVKR
jgi:hypothetical protein